MTPNAISRNPVRSGFTMVELLVTLTVIGILMALVLPAVMSARSAARKTQCKNNLRQVGMAILHGTESKLQFPVAGYWGNLGNLGPHHNWVVQILPWIEQKAIADAWKFDKFLTHPDNQDLANRPIPILVCPEDGTRTGQGDLSYVVNSGMGYTTIGSYIASHFGGIDLNGDGVACGVDSLQPEPNNPSDRDYYHRMGLMFVDNWPTPTTGQPIRRHTLSSIRDGLTHTLMLAENVHAGAQPGSPSGLANWASPEPWRSMFNLSPYICHGLSCTPGAVDYQRANNRTDPEFQRAALNYLPDTDANLEGASPFPSSHHTGGLHVMFTDGRVHFLSENVDGRVYATLVSPQGVALLGPLAQQVVSDGEY